MAPLIAYICGGDPVAGAGGASSYARAHARAAVRAGFEPHLFCIGREEETVRTEFGTVHRTASRLRLRRSSYVPGFRNYLLGVYERRLATRLETFMARTGRVPQLIHSLGPWGGAGARVSRRLSARGVSVVPVVSAFTTLRDEFDARLRGVTRAHGLRVWLWAALDCVASRCVVDSFERRAYRTNELVLVNYDSVRRLLIATVGDDIRIRKIPYAPETAFRDGDGPRPPLPDLSALEPREAPLIMAVSRQDPRKGVDVLLRALARLRSRGVRFRACLVGGGALLGPHRRLARRLGLGPESLLPGVVRDSYVYLRHADVFVLPSLQEASGSLSLLEALQAGAAVVASRVDGIPEDVEDGRSALLTPPGSDEALAHALTRVLEDDDLRRRLSAQGRATFEARFSADGMSSALAALYGELLDGSRRRALG